MAADEPPYLTVGTDVSAKYKGAFCEAKIKKVARAVKCKVTFKNGQGTAVVPDDQIQGNLRVGAHIEAKHPDKNQMLEAVINKLLDYSQYTVVFDDGDETTLRRTSLCLKSGRHFAESESLDQLPLTNPEHFGTPVIGSKTRRKRSSVVCAAALDDESSEEDLPQPKRQPKDRGRASSASTASSASKNVDLGRVVCVEQGSGRGNKKENWFPALIVSPSAQENLRLKFDHLVRSFKDGKYFQVPKKDTKEFTRAMAAKVEGPALKTAVEKALTFMDKDELPPNWDRDTLMGLNQQSEDSHDSDSDTSDDEPSEEKDRFVAQLYKFMDERGTPINRAPSVGSRDLNLYKLFKIVQKIGGYNRVTNLNQWKNVFLRLGLPNYNTTSSHQTKQAYKKYLHSFEDFFRKLGCTMVSNTRHSRGRYRTDRNLMMTRNRERDLSTTRAKSYSKGSKKDEEKRKTRTSLVKEESEEMMPSTSGALKDVCSSSASSLSSLPGLEDKKDTKVKRESSPSSLIEEKSTSLEKKKELKVKQETRKNYLQEGGDSSDDNVPLIQEASIKEEQDETPGKKEKVKRKDSRDESISKKTKKGEEAKDGKTKMGFSDSKKQKKELKRCDSKDSPFQDRKSGESDLDSSSDLDSPKNRKYSDGGMDDSFKKGCESFGHKKPKKRKKEGGPDGDGDDDNDGKETDIEEFCQRTGGINIGDKIRVKYGHGGQHKIYEAKVLKIDEKLPKPYYVHYTGWNMRYDEWIRRSRIVENVSSSSVGKKKKSTTSKLPGPPKSSGKRGRPSLASVHSDSGSSTQSTSLSPASSRKTSSPTNSRSRHTRSEKINLTGGLEPRKRVRRKSGATGETKDSDIDESLLSDIEDDGSESKSMEDKDEEPIPEDGEDESGPIECTKIDQFSEPPVVSHPTTSETCLKLVPDVLSKVESDDDQELLMRNEDNKDPLPIKIEEILDMISPLSDDNLPPSFAPHLDMHSPKEDNRIMLPSSIVSEETTPSQAKETSVIVRRVSVEKEKIPILEDPKVSVKPDNPLNLSSATEIIGSLDEDTESEDEALINFCVPKNDDITPTKDTLTDHVNEVQIKEFPDSSLECGIADEKEVTSTNHNFIDCSIPVDLKEEEKKEVVTFHSSVSPPLRDNLQIPSSNRGSDAKEMVVEEQPYIKPTDLIIPKEATGNQSSFEAQDENTSKDVVVQKLVIEKPIVVETEKKIEVDVEEEDKYAWVDETEEKEEAERLREVISPKKETKKKRKVQKQDAKDEIKPKPKKKKSENIEDLSKEHKQKKIKKNKIKKKNEKSESSDANSDGKKTIFGESKTSSLLLASDKKKKERKKKEEKKLNKSEITEPSSVSHESSLFESLKKKKIKKNKEKLSDSPLQDKKIKKKKKQLAVDDETEGDKSETDKAKLVKKKKRKSKLKEPVPSLISKDPIIMPSTSTTTLEIKSVKEVKDTPKKEKKPKQDTSLLIPLSVNIKQEVEIEETEREMSFLLCEENVPASPIAVEPCPDKEDKNEEDQNYLGKLKSFAKITSTLAPSSSTAFGASSTSENIPTGLCFSHFPPNNSSLELNNAAENVNTNRGETEMSAVLDNTPPTTPESSGSLLSSTPPHEDERADFKLMRNTTREAPECEDTSSRSTDSSSASTSSSGVLGGSSALVPESRVQKTSYMSKRPKMDLDRHYEALPTKRRRKSGKANEPTKPLAKPLITGRPIKVERDSDNTPNISSLHSTMECSYSDSLFINASPPPVTVSSALSLQSLSTAIATVPNIPIRPNRPSKFNFDDPLDENVDANKRITVLQDRMTELRKIYIGLKAEVALIDRRRKKAKKKDKDRDHSNSGASAASSKDNSNQGNSGSSSSLMQLTDTQTS